MGTKELFLGVWQLADSYDVSIKTGQIVRSRGATPVGSLSYNIDGNMAVQVMNDGRPHLSDLDRESAAEKIKAAFENYTAYFGTFEINKDEGYVIHHIRGSLFPDEVGKTRKRFFQISGNRL